MGNIFAGKNVGKYRSTKGGNYFKPGKYVARLLSAKGIYYGHGERNEDKETAFVAEFEILESNAPESHKVGDHVSYFVKISDAQYPETALGNVADCARAMIACQTAMEGEDPGSIDAVEIDDDLLGVITGDDQPMVGTVMGVLAVNIVTRKGNDFTKVSFFVPETAAQYAAA